MYMLKFIRTIFRKKRLDKCRELNKEKLSNTLQLSLKNIPSKISYRMIEINRNFTYLQYKDIGGNWMYINLSTMLPEKNIKDYSINNLFKSDDSNFIKDFIMKYPNIGDTLDKNYNKLLNKK